MWQRRFSSGRVCARTRVFAGVVLGGLFGNVAFRVGACACALACASVCVCARFFTSSLAFVPLAHKLYNKICFVHRIRRQRYIRIKISRASVLRLQIQTSSV